MKGKEKTKEEIMADANDRIARKEKRDMERAEKERVRAEKAAERERVRAEKAEAKAKKEAERTARIAEKAGELEEMFGDNAASIELDMYGKPVKSIENLVAVTDKCLDLPDRLRKNLFTHRYEIDGWDMTDEHINEIVWDVAKALGWHDKEKVLSRINYIAAKHAYHPILDKVKSIEWDGKERLCTFFINAVGAIDTPLNRELSFRWLLGMYRRVARPGCVFDAYLALQDSKQGTGKSKVFEKLTVNLGITDPENKPICYTETGAGTDLADKDNCMKIDSACIVEFDEAGLVKFNNKFKSFITTSSYTVRLPYAAKAERHLLHTMYAITTNDEKFLTDHTTSFERRAWIMLCDGVFRTDQEYWEPRTGKEVIQQVWAESKYWNEHPDEVFGKYGWRTENESISKLSDEGADSLEAVQERMKTSGDDVRVITTLQDILNRKYTKADFQSFEEFENELNGYRTSVGAPADKRLDCIPVKWLYAAVINKACRGGNGRSGSYFEYLMGTPDITDECGTWFKKERHLYRGTERQTTCWMRGGSKQKKKPVPMAKNTVKNTAENEVKTLPPAKKGGSGSGRVTVMVNGKEEEVDL